MQITSSFGIYKTNINHNGSYLPTVIWKETVTKFSNFI